MQAAIPTKTCQQHPVCLTDNPLPHPHRLYSYVIPGDFIWFIQNWTEIWRRFQSKKKDHFLKNTVVRFRTKQSFSALNFQSLVLKIWEHLFPFPWSHRFPYFLEKKQFFFSVLLTQLDLYYDSLSFQKQNKIATILHQIFPDICWSQKLFAGCIRAYTEIISILLRSAICKRPKHRHSVQRFLFEVL